MPCFAFFCLVAVMKQFCNETELASSDLVLFEFLSFHNIVMNAQTDLFTF